MELFGLTSALVTRGTLNGTKRRVEWRWLPIDRGEPFTSQLGLEIN